MRCIAYLLAGILAGCASAPSPPDFPGNSAAGASFEEPEYRLHEGDQVEIRFPAFPDWNANVTVQPDGVAHVPLVGAVQFSGRTLAQIKAQLAVELDGRVKSPRVELVLTSLHPRSVFVGGEVELPGKIPIDAQRYSLVQALFAAGGPIRKSANLDRVVLSRIDDQGIRKAWTVDAMACLDGSASAVFLLPGDVLLVPATGVADANLFIEQYITNMVPGGNLLTGYLLAK